MFNFINSVILQLILSFIERVDRMEKIYEKILFLVIPITMFLFLYIENRKLKGLALLIGVIIFILGKGYQDSKKKL